MNPFKEISSHTISKTRNNKSKLINEDNPNNIYFDMNDSDIDNLLMGIKLDDVVEDNNKTNMCINCKSLDLLIDNIKSTVICNNCGVVNKEYLDENPETLANENNTNSRYGAPTSIFFPISCLGTKIVGNNRLSMLQRQGQVPYKEKSLMDVLDNIQYKCKLHNISQTVIDTAKIYYKKYSEIVHTSGKRKGKPIIMRCINRKSIIAGCLYQACKNNFQLATPKQIADIYDLEIKHVIKGCTKVIEKLPDDIFFTQTKSPQPSDFIHSASKKLNIEAIYINKMMNVAKALYNKGGRYITEHEPQSTAAACVVLIIDYYNLLIPIKEITKIYDDISEVTINSIKAEIEKNKDDILEVEDFIYKYSNKLNMEKIYFDKIIETIDHIYILDESYKQQKKSLFAIACILLIYEYYNITFQTKDIINILIYDKIDKYDKSLEDTINKIKLNLYNIKDIIFNSNIMNLIKKTKK